MKKHFIYGLIIIAGVLYSVSCQKSEPIAPESEQQETTPEVTPEDAKPSGPVYITATIPDDDISSKVSFEKDGTKWKRTWEVGDEVSVNGTIFTVQSVAVDGTATLYSETAPDEADSYTITYGSFSNSQTRSADGDATGLSVFRLSGVRDYKAITFSSAWAEENGGAYSESGVLYLRAKMPTTEIAAAVKQVKITAVDSEGNPNNLFGEDNEVTVTFENPGDEEADGILDIFVNLSSPTAQNVEGASFLVRFSTEADINNADFRYTRYYTFASGIALQPGQVNKLSLNCAETASHAGSPTADGATAANAYLIGDKYQLAAVNGLLESDTKYFKLIADIDMTGVKDWNGINKTSPYLPYIFDGNNKTVSNLAGPLFYLIKGTVKDLTLDNFDATGYRGVLAEYIQGADNLVSNITITNGTVNSTQDNVGGLIGNINSSGTTATITNCTVSDTNVKGRGVVGGMIGFADAQVTVSGCTYTGGKVESNNRFCGGLFGSTGNYASVITDCHVKNATVSSPNDRVGGFIGQLQRKVQIKGCTVGTSDQRVTVESTATGTTVNVGGFVGVCYGTVTKNGEVRSQAFVTITSSNTTVETNVNIGGFGGYLDRCTIEYSDADAVMSSITGQQVGGFAAWLTGDNTKIDNCTSNSNVKGNNYTGGFIGNTSANNHIVTNNTASGTVKGAAAVGGFAGQVAKGINVSDCSANNVTVEGTVNIGGFVGVVGYGIFTSCTSSGTVDSINDVKDQDIALGGFVGYFENGEISKCSSSVSIEHTTRGRDIGGFVGTMLQGTIEKSFATGKASGTQRNVGGFAGLITNDASSSVIIRDCYCTGDVVANSYNGGFAGLVEKGTVVIANSYSISDVEAVAFAAGGFVGVQTSATCTIENCAAWNSSVTAGSIGSGNWSSGAVIGVCFPKCTVTNTYRNPGMSLTAYWVPEAFYDHPDVSSDHPLVKQNGNETTATSTASGQDGYPMFPYHGHVYFDFEKTLSMLAFSTLIWSSDIWDLSNDLPTLY